METVIVYTEAFYYTPPVLYGCSGSSGGPLGPFLHGRANRPPFVALTYRRHWPSRNFLFEVHAWFSPYPKELEYFRLHYVLLSSIRAWSGNWHNMNHGHGNAQSRIFSRFSRGFSGCLHFYGRRPECSGTQAETVCRTETWPLCSSLVTSRIQ